MKRFFLTVAILFVALISTTSLSARELHVVPEPAYVDLEAEGEYVVTEKTRIIVVDDLWAPAARFTEDMMSYYGSDKPMRTSKHGNKGIKVRLDRFVPAKKVKEILLAVKQHKVDLLCGTHKLLSKYFFIFG